jgi:hypothetical protein
MQELGPVAHTKAVLNADARLWASTIKARIAFADGHRAHLHTSRAKTLEITYE